MQKLKTYLATGLATITLLGGCQKLSSSGSENATGLRLLTTNERAQDLDQLLTLFQSYYGPYQYKEVTLGIHIDQLVTDLKAQAATAKTDEEFAGLVMRFGAALHDGHVQIAVASTTTGISRYKVPMLIVPVEDKILIGDITDDLAKATGFAKGDEVLAVDGQPPRSYLPTIFKYATMARSASDQHLIAYLLSRPSYMTDLVPTSPLVRIQVKSIGGVVSTQEIPWTPLHYNDDVANAVRPSARINLTTRLAQELNSVTGNIRQMGDVNPFFLTPETQTRYHFIKVYPDDETRKAFGLAPAEKPPIYAALYRYSGKNVLLVRQASYSQDDFKPEIYLKAYMALLSQYQEFADVLVLDQTHNPGGSYCASFYDIFGRDGDVQSAELLHADRKWINDLETAAVVLDPKVVGTFDDKTSVAWGTQVEQAYDAGQFFSPAIPLFSGAFFSQKQAFRWTKPMLVLIDELAGSCGDMFPMIVKANKRAKLFGKTTMGLGGNVEEVGTLNNSRIAVKLTRGLFFPYLNGRAPQPTDFVENHGVSPDYVYDHTVDDTRAGFVGYVDAFSAKALEQLP